MCSHGVWRSGELSDVICRGEDENHVPNVEHQGKLRQTVTETLRDDFIFIMFNPSGVF